MANWNYRVIRKHCAKSGMVTLQIHEVYYAEDGSVDCWTQQPVEPLGTSEPQLRNDVHAFLAAFRKPLLEEKLVLGQLQLVEEKNSQMVLDDLRRDYLSRINRASGYLFQMLGNHLLLKQNPSLAKAYDQVDRALAELCDAVEASVVRQKVG
jgi:hypothetical protein